MTTIYDNTFNHLFEGFIKFVSIRIILNNAGLKQIGT